MNKIRQLGYNDYYNNIIIYYNRSVKEYFSSLGTMTVYCLYVFNTVPQSELGGFQKLGCNHQYQKRNRNKLNKENHRLNYTAKSFIYWLKTIL